MKILKSHHYDKLIKNIKQLMLNQLLIVRKKMYNEMLSSIKIQIIQNYVVNNMENNHVINWNLFWDKNSNILNLKTFKTELLTRIFF